MIQVILHIVFPYDWRWLCTLFTGEPPCSHVLSPHVIQIILRNFAFKTRQTFICTPTHNATILCMSAFYCLTPLICQNMIRYKTLRWLEQAASSSISLNKYQANEWILNSHCCLYHKTDLCFISFRHLQTLFRKMQATCSNKIFLHSFFFFYPHPFRFFPQPAATSLFNHRVY